MNLSPRSNALLCLPFVTAFFLKSIDGFCKDWFDFYEMISRRFFKSGNKV